MGLIKGGEQVRRVLGLLIPFFIFLFALNPLFAQAGSGSAAPSETAVSLASGISRLERIAVNANGSPKERYDAYLSLSRLYQLCGDTEAALKACDGALAIFPSDGRSLLEQGRLLISLGQYEKAAASLNALFIRSQDRELLLQGRYLGALLEAFKYNSALPLAAIADDPDFIAYRSGIYYTLWKLTALSYWQNRLAAEFPQSPEAKIVTSAASGSPAGSANTSVQAAPTPLWLLFPGRDSVVVSSPSPSAIPPSPAPPVSPIPAAPQAVSQSTETLPAGQVTFLQAGIFGREENAKALAERLKNSGFDSQISKRQANNSDLWAVLVSGGADLNATIKKLKDAGFESFPVR